MVIYNYYIRNPYIICNGYLCKTLETSMHNRTFDYRTYNIDIYKKKLDKVTVVYT